MTRSEFWIMKIARNNERDRQVIEKLIKNGWRVLVVWECAMRGVGKLQKASVLDCCETFVRQRDIVRGEIAATTGCILQGKE